MAVPTRRWSDLLADPTSGVWLQHRSGIVGSRAQESTTHASNGVAALDHDRRAIGCRF